MDTYSKKSTGYFLKKFILIFFMILLFYLFISYTTQNTDMIRDKITKNEISVISSASNLMEREFNTLLADLEFLHLSVINDIDDVKREEETLLNYAQTHSQIDQIRVINEDGYEQYRVDNELIGTIVVEGENLQYKGEKYYYKSTAELENGEVFISRMDLNMENGEIEEPVKPMIRLGTPLYVGDRFEGILIINVKVEEVLKSVAELFNLSEGHIFVIDDNGNYIQNSIDSSREFSFMYDEESVGAFADDYHGFWDYMSDTENGTTFNDEGVFAYEAVASEELLSQRKISIEKNIYIVSYIPKESEVAEVFYMGIYEYAINAISSNATVIILLIIISLIISFLLTINRNASNKAEFYASYDVMTKAYNRRRGFELVSEHFDNYLKNRKYNSCISYVDIDNLKIVNDTYGHTEGDKLIVDIANIIQDNLGENHFFIRYGGDEFLILFKYESLDYVKTIMEEIQEEFNKLNEESNKKYKLSISHGTVDLKNDVTNIDDLIKLADNLMYENKQKKKYVREVTRK